MKICLVGNPNSGKTTLFNLLTGLNQKVGNYSGVTVDKYQGKLKLKDQEIDLIDLPGTHSIYPKSIDEEIVFKTLINKAGENHPDLVLLVVSASQIRRGLILVTQVMDLDIPVVVAVNMIDEVSPQIDQKLLEEAFQVPVCLISARKNIGISNLKEQLLQTPKNQKQSKKRFEVPSELQEEIKAITKQEDSYRNLLNYILAEKSTDLSANSRMELLALQSKNNASPNKLIGQDINARFKFINEVMTKIQKKNQFSSTSLTTTQKIDRLLTNKYLGLPIAFLVLYFIFESIFTFAGPPMDVIESFFGWLGQIVGEILPEGWFRDLMINGIIAGLGGVLVFIPQIAILFGLLAILEGTGYLSRISFMLDRLMRSFGLSGKSVVPMMSGFACAIPAVMSTRTIQSKKERLINIMVIPLLSCSARLPVYILLIGMFIPKKKVLGIFSAQGLTMQAFYFAGLILAILIAGLLHRILKVDEKPVFVMEMPRYRVPDWRNVLLTMYQKAKIFTLEAGKIILLISVVLWVLASYGPKQKMAAVNDKYALLQDHGAELTAQQQLDYNNELLVNSYAGHIGKAIEPVIQPLGYDWKIGIALLTSFAAREVFVGTMATIYSMEVEDEENPKSLQEKLLAETNPKTGKAVYSFATVFSLLIFFAFAMQCMSTLAIVKRETKSWKWPMIQLVYLTILAYSLSFLAYQILK